MMNATQAKAHPPEMAVAVTLAQLLDRLERSPVRVDPDQYRLVARRLADAITALPPGQGLDQLLAASPSAAETYENLNYQYAGLCRSPLEPALRAELTARGLVARNSGASAMPPEADPSR